MEAIKRKNCFEKSEVEEFGQMFKSAKQGEECFLDGQ